MDHVGILKHAIHTTLHHRALWILGFFWALVGGGGGISSFSSPASGTQYTVDGREFESFSTAGGFDFPWLAVTSIVSLFVFACCLLFFVGILVIALNYVLRAGIYRTLHGLDTHGTSPTVRGGFREGWNRRTWRLLFQDLIVWIPFVLIVIVSMLVVALPIILAVSGGRVATAIGLILTIGLFILWLALVIGGATILGVLQHFWGRAAAIDDQSVSEGIGSAWRLARQNPGDVVIIWLLMTGIGILWTLIMIPLVLLILALAAGIAFIPGYILYLITSNELISILFAVAVGIVAMIVPIAFVVGMYQIFRASVWNQVYDQLAQHPKPVQV